MTIITNLFCFAYALELIWKLYALKICLQPSVTGTPQSQLRLIGKSIVLKVPVYGLSEKTFRIKILVANIIARELKAGILQGERLSC
jgi:hypothetical protein